MDPRGAQVRRRERVAEDARERPGAKPTGLDGVSGDIGLTELDDVTVQSRRRQLGHREPVVREVQER